MIKRLYIDNYRCLVNFDWRPGTINLLLGPNGAGKSAVFDALHLLRTFVVGQGRTDKLFTEDLLTRWQTLPDCRFELDVELNDGIYRYVLAIRVDRGRERARILQETLHLDAAPLFAMEGNEAQLYHDDGTPGPQVTFDWTQSGIGFLQPRQDNRKLLRFREFLAGVLVTRLNPFAMERESRGEVEWPNVECSDYVPWYRYMSQEHQGQLGILFEALQELFEGFRALRLVRTGESSRTLRLVTLTDDGRETEYSLDELSHGQRALLALYGLLELGIASGTVTALCIDEPDNFVSAREIQPWLMALRERCDEGGAQAFIISHHPEIIDILAPEAGYWLDREANTHTRIRPVTEPDVPLRLSELIARDWYDG